MSDDKATAIVAETPAVETASEEGQKWTPADRSAISDEDLGKLLEGMKNAPPAEETEKAATETVEKTEEPAPAPQETAEDRLSKLEKQIADKEAMIQRQANELGEARKMLREIPRKVKDEDVDDETEDPVDIIGDKTKWNAYVDKAVEKRIQRFLKQRQLAEVDERIRLDEARATTKAIVSKSVKDFETLLPDMLAVAKETGDSDETLNQFKSDPYSFEPAVIINLARMAQYKRRLDALESKAKSLEEKPKELAQKIVNATKTSTSVNGKSAGSTSTVGVVRLSKEQVASLDDKQLAVYLAEMKRRESQTRSE